MRITMELPRLVIFVSDRRKSQALLAPLRGTFLPNKVVAVSDKPTSTGMLVLLANKKAIEGDPTAYVCEAGTCKLPTRDPALTLEMAAAFVPLNLRESTRKEP